jgi:hypothetical protein
VSYEVKSAEDECPEKWYRLSSNAVGWIHKMQAEGPLRMVSRDCLGCDLCGSAWSTFASQQEVQYRPDGCEQDDGLNEPGARGRRRVLKNRDHSVVSFIGWRQIAFNVCGTTQWFLALRKNVSESYE